MADFAALGSNITEGSVENFFLADFDGEGRELEALQFPNFNSQPALLGSVPDPLLKAFTQTVHGFWAQLIRATNDSALCTGGRACESSLIPLNHTFVVPGGRFREQCEPKVFGLKFKFIGRHLDYWDSFWIVEGLIQSELYDVANATLQNFMDEIEHIGFIPNGGRIYCKYGCAVRFFCSILIYIHTVNRFKSITASDVYPCL